MKLPQPDSQGPNPPIPVLPMTIRLFNDVRTARTFIDLFSYGEEGGHIAGVNSADVLRPQGALPVPPK